MRNKLVVALYLIFLCSCLIFGQRLQPESKIVVQATAPIKINTYTTKYIGERSAYVSKGIHHDLEYENVSGRNIVAAQFGLVSFDIWNEYLDRLGGVSMTPLSAGSKNKGSWVATAYADFSFQTGVSYVSRVRFDNGEIWLADLNAVLAELKKIERDFDLARLKKKEDGND